MRTKIFVVDDHPVVCDGLAMRIDSEADMIVVARTGSAAQVILGVKKHAVDAIRQVLDGKPYLGRRLFKLFTKPQRAKLLA